MVWYGMVWYGMVWYGMVWYGMQADQKLLKKGELGGEVRGHEGSLRGFQGSILLPWPLIALNVICQASQRRALLGLAYLHKAHQVLPPLQGKPVTIYRGILQHQQRVSILNIVSLITLRSTAYNTAS